MKYVAVFIAGMQLSLWQAVFPGQTQSVRENVLP